MHIPPPNCNDRQLRIAEPKETPKPATTTSSTLAAIHQSDHPAVQKFRDQIVSNSKKPGLQNAIFASQKVAVLEELSALAPSKNSKAPNREEAIESQ